MAHVSFSGISGIKILALVNTVDILVRSSRAIIDVNWISDGLITRRIDYVPKNLLGILYGAPFLVFVAQKNQLMLLSSPETPHALSINFDHSERQHILIQHDYFVLIRVLGKLMPQRQQAGHTGQHSAPPHRVSLITDHTLLVKLGQTFMQTLLVSQVTLKVVLVQSKSHADRWQHNFFQQIHVIEDPFVFGRLDANVPFEQSVVAMLK
ncbi:hypothetical protein BpHYR1_026452 [Brachionus plicatilis]|uniref:Uncharacterized protein n=1 Tax=Brachionus plicatilis TaxID=10195 RepID=A0A3M7QX04_BRAPC|nr:hypothetical protein BpHYR1_026452 [Brachionus plicatilis]